MAQSILGLLVLIVAFAAMMAALIGAYGNAIGGGDNPEAVSWRGVVIALAVALIAFALGLWLLVA